MRDEWTWKAYFEQELMLSREPCPECRMRTFHLPWCSRTTITEENIEAGRQRRALIEEMERDR